MSSLPNDCVHSIESWQLVGAGGQSANAEKETSHRLGIVLLFGLVGAGCGKTGISEDDYEVALVRTQCDRIASCCSEVDALFDRGACEQFFDAWNPSGGSGVVYDARAAEECVNAVETSSCLFDDEKLLGACDRVYRGTRSPGADCETSQQCALPVLGTAYCDIPGGASSGICIQQSHARLGQQCGAYKCHGTTLCNHGPCADGLFCGSTGICEEPRGAGESCEQPLHCEQGLPCLNGVCSEAQAGDACNDADDCTGDLRCDLSGGVVGPGSEGACFQPFEDGSRCVADLECLTGRCEDETCSPDVARYCPFIATPP